MQRPDTSPQDRTRTSLRVRILAVGLALVLGLLGGLAVFAFGYGEGAAYLIDDPASCANCHVMWENFESWNKSSHGGFATCNDCHLPHDTMGKWITKADNGFFHSLAFTTGRYPEPIRIKPRNRRVTQGTCLYCHGDFVNHMLPAVPGGEVARCVTCHSDVGHALR